jgi:prepilin-type N-terminal cleavage/methylation domain-containing protein
MTLYRESGVSRESGFSLVELMIVVAIGATLCGFAMIASGAALTTFKAQGVLSKVQSQIALARELAISQQRDMRLIFTGTNQLSIQRQDKPTGTTTMSTIAFEGGLTYVKVSSLPETPDAWGGNNAIAFDPVDFTSTGAIQFRGGTGQLVDASTLLPVSGRVFVAVAGKKETAGVVSIFGPTGRVRAYHWEGSWNY